MHKDFETLRMRIFFWHLKLIICETLLLITCTNGQVDTRITGGEDANPNEFPFLVSIRRIDTGRPFCGGTILNAQWILTAAHCLIIPVDQMEIVAGQHALDVNEDTEQIRRIDVAFPHPDYVDLETGNDIALLRLTTNLDLNDVVQIISLEPEGYVEARDTTIMGWGSLQFDNPDLPNILQKATIPIFDQQQCGDFFNLVDSMMCAGGGGQGVCSGDSGGPLICSSLCNMAPVQCGIVSFGRERCADEGIPEVFTRVTPFINFLRTIIAENSRAARITEL